MYYFPFAFFAPFIYKVMYFLLELGGLSYVIGLTFHLMIYPVSECTDQLLLPLNQ